MNQETIDLLEDLRETFSRTVGGEWRFYREEQKTLEQFAVRRVADTEREFEEVPFHTFESELKSGPLANMVSAQAAIKSICNAGIDTEIINGRERLKKAQSFLVEILNKMETRVNYSVFRGTRENYKLTIVLKPVP